MPDGPYESVMHGLHVVVCESESQATEVRETWELAAKRQKRLQSLEAEVRKEQEIHQESDRVVEALTTRLARIEEAAMSLDLTTILRAIQDQS